MRYVAINFHRKALAERLAENHLGLTALDRLSNAHPAPTSKRNPYRDSVQGQAVKKGHKSRFSSVDLFGMVNANSGLRGRGHTSSVDENENGNGASSTVSGGGSPVLGEKGGKVEGEGGVTGGVFSAQQSPDPAYRPDAKTSHITTTPITEKKNRKRNQQKAKRGAMTSVIVDQLGGMIGSVALKDSKFNRDQFSSLASAGKLARKLFKTLSDVYPPREHLIVEGQFILSF